MSPSDFLDKLMGRTSGYDARIRPNFKGKSPARAAESLCLSFHGNPLLGYSIPRFLAWQHIRGPWLDRGGQRRPGLAEGKRLTSEQSQRRA